MYILESNRVAAGVSACHYHAPLRAFTASCLVPARAKKAVNFGQMASPLSPQQEKRGCRDANNVRQGAHWCDFELIFCALFVVAI